MQGILARYSATVIARIQSRKQYPEEARAAQAEGKVQLSFTLAADGSLLSAAVVSGSGHSALDAAALGAVRAAAPFAPIPAELQRNSAKLSVTLRFELE